MRRGFCVIKHVHSLKCIVNAAQDFFRGYAKIFRTESDILLNHCRHNLIIGILKNHADFFAYIKRFRFIRRVHSEHSHAAGRRKLQCIEHFCKCGFTAAVMPDNCNKFTVRNAYADPAESLRFGVLV